MGFLAKLFFAGIRDYRYAKRRRERVQREKEKVARFNERWQKLNHIYISVPKNFLVPLEPLQERLTNNELTKLYEYLVEMKWWRTHISNNINSARQSDLSRYAVCLKQVAIKSMKLCKKYGVRSDIQTIEYIAKKKILYLNGRKYCSFN